MKICTKCKIEKEISMFHKEKRNPSGLCTRCKDCVKIVYNKYRQSEKGLNTYKKYYFDNNKKIRTRIKNWQDDNKEKVKEGARRREKTDKFKKSPKYVFHVIKQNSKRKNREFVLDQKKFINWYTAQSKICFYCGIDEDYHNIYFGKRLEIDRVDNCIGYTVENMVLCCRFCNSVKGCFLDKEEMVLIGNEIIKNKWNKIKKLV